MREFIEEYACAVFKWWWVMVIGFGGGGITYVQSIWTGLNIPIWGPVALAILGIFVAQVLAYHKLRDRLRNQIIRPNQIEAVLTALAKCREHGVNLRNDGENLRVNIRTQDMLAKWIEAVQIWRDGVISEIEKISPSQAGIFAIEDRVDTSQYTAFFLEHKLYLGIISKDIEKIRKLVERFSPENLAKRSGIEK